MSASSDLARVRTQLYVDDPAMGFAEIEKQIVASQDLILLYWSLLGSPLAWAKGSETDAAEGHDWIGVHYRGLEPGVAQMTLPEAFLVVLRVPLLPLATGKGHTALQDIDSFVGEVGRVACVADGTAICSEPVGSPGSALESRRKTPTGSSSC